MIEIEIARQLILVRSNVRDRTAAIADLPENQRQRVHVALLIRADAIEIEDDVLVQQLRRHVQLGADAVVETLDAAALNLLRLPAGRSRSRCV